MNWNTTCVNSIWMNGLSKLKAEFNISVGNKIDERSCRRIAILVTELFIKTFPQKNTQLSFVLMEPEVYRIARERKLICDPLEAEIIHPGIVDLILKTWGPDKATGFNTKITNLEEWLTPLWGEGNGREAAVRERCDGVIGSQEVGIGSNAQKRAGIRQGL